MKAIQLIGLLVLFHFNSSAQIDANGATTYSKVLTSYDTLIPILGGLFITHTTQKWGVVDRSGNIVVPFECDGISSFSDSTGIAAIYTDSYSLPTGVERYHYEGVYFFFTKDGRSEKTGGDFTLKIEYEGMHSPEYVLLEGPSYFLPDIIDGEIQTRPWNQYNIRSMER